ncbi:MAG: NB-ARC domain-containing protein [Xenococcaceae cyanobacterium]
MSPASPDDNLLPDVSVFYGRDEELDTLKQWIVLEKCRAIAIVGMTGIGKTTLVAKVVNSLDGKFDRILWRSLRYVDSFSQFLQELIKSLSDGEENRAIDNIDLGLSRLLGYLRASRCLLILDDWQLAWHTETDINFKDKEYYNELLKKVGEIRHQSCIIVNSNEKSEIMSLLEGECVRCLSLQGLGTSAREIFRSKNLQEEQLWQQLIDNYRGNPQQLKLVSNIIKEIFGGNVSQFLQQQTYLNIVVDRNTEKQLDEQFDRLSPLEKQILQILATAGKPLTLEQLRKATDFNAFHSELAGAIASLNRQLLLEISNDKEKQLFSLQPMVMKHIVRQHLPETVISPPLLSVNSPKQSNLSAQTNQPQQETQPSQDREKFSNSQQNIVLMPSQQPQVLSPQTQNNNVSPPQSPSINTQTPTNIVPLRQPQQSQVIPASDATNIIPQVRSPHPLVVQPQNSGNIFPSPANLIPSVGENDFLPPISRWTRLGGMFIVGAVGIGFIGSAFTPYSVTVKAQANVRPAGELRVVEAKTEGRIVEIMVKENQTVKMGEVIVSIDPSRFQTKKDQLENNIEQSKLQLERIDAQIKSQERQIAAETEKINRTIDVAQAQLSRSNREYQDKRITSSALVNEAIANLRVAERELNQAQTELEAAKATLKSKQAELNAAKAKQQRYQSVASSGALPQNLLEEATLAVQQQEQAFASQQATVNHHQEGIEKQRQVLAAVQAKLANAKTALNPSNADVEISTENIDREKATGEAALAGLNREKEALMQQQIEVQKQLQQDESELLQVTNELKQTAIEAPIEGTLFQLQIRNSGQTVKPGDRIAQIAPSNASMAIESLVSAQEISKIKTGQKAQIRVSACPYPDYGTLKGAVRNISPDVISTNNSAGGSNLIKDRYQVTIEPQSLVLKQGNKQCRLQVGMEGKADIVTSEETVLQFLFRKAKLIADF